MQKHHPLTYDFTTYADSEIKGKWHIEFATTYPMGESICTRKLFDARFGSINIAIES